MSKEFNQEAGVNVEEVQEAAKPKRVRKSPAKIQKTAVEIITEILTLEGEVNELGNALSGLAADNVAYTIVEKAFVAKGEELEKARSAVYTA
jgi:hypothetical protein